MASTTAPPSSASSPSDGGARPLTIVELVTVLADPARRPLAVPALAQHLGVADLLVFVRDPELGVLLPGPGFPQTLPDGRRWRAFLAACVAEGRHTGEVPLPGKSAASAATGLAASGDAVLVLVGGEPAPEDAAVLVRLLPLLAAALRDEHTARVAEGQARAAREAAAQLSALAAVLGQTQGALQQAIHETALAQAATRAERDRLRQVLDVLPEAVMVADAQGRCIHANQAARALLGVDPIGVTLSEADATVPHVQVSYPDGRPYSPGDLPLRRAVFRGEAVYGAQFILKRAEDARVIPVLANSAPLRDESGAGAGGVIVFQDISEIKDLERQKDEFLASAAHDLKNPLTAITSLAQLLQRRAARVAGADGESLAEGLATICQAAIGMARQVTELLDAARLQMAQRLDLDLQPTDIAELALQVEQEYTRGSARHTFRLDLAGSPLVCICDRARLHRALANLLANALKYSPAGGTITLSLRRAEDETGAWAMIRVIDQGLGIPAVDLPRVFVRFYRASNVGGIGGTGLGLAGAREIIEQHGGTIDLASEVGVGTTVTVRLPLAPPPGGGPATPAGSGREGAPGQ